jgi:hypothetical protein
MVRQYRHAFDPLSTHVHRGLRGPQPACEAGNKTPCCMREVGTELHERGTRALSLALLWRCWHGARGVMNVSGKR